MDPNATLREIRNLTSDCDNDSSWRLALSFDHLELIEHVNALDEWLSKGGFLPTDWERGDNK